MHEGPLKNIFFQQNNYWQPCASMNTIADHGLVPAQDGLVWNTSIHKYNIENIQLNCEKLDFSALILIS